MKQLEIWVKCVGVRPPSCNHAARNLTVHLVTSSYEHLDCQVCGVRKSYKISASGGRKLIGAIAIRKVSL